MVTDISSKKSVFVPLICLYAKKYQRNSGSRIISFSTEQDLMIAMEYFYVSFKRVSLRQIQCCLLETLKTAINNDIFSTFINC